MILRRVIEHVKTQNWTAVAIDFVIVVVGVFMGIQVSNWNDALADRAEARQLIGRLHEETRGLLEIQRAEYNRQLPRAETMIRIHHLLFDDLPNRPLSALECKMIGISHWLPAPTDELPILDEAVSTGRIDLIGNQDVKASLRSFALVRDRARRHHAENINELFRLSSRHPDAIWIALKPSEETVDPAWRSTQTEAQQSRRAGDGMYWANECDLEIMRGSNAFLADYADNVSRLNSFVERYEKMIAVLTQLETALSAGSDAH